MSNLIGGNGQGFFQNLDETTIMWLKECFNNRPFVINFPGGADANLVTPSFELKGWGLTEEIINERFAAGQIDENGEGLDKWLEKLEQQNQEPQSYLYNLGELKKEFPQMEIVWKANIVTGSLDSAKKSFESVYSVFPFSKCVMGNEVYSKGNFSFDFRAFLVKAEPLIDWIRKNYPNVKIAIPFAPNLKRKDHTRWNNDLISFAKTTTKVDAVDVHIYLTEDDLIEAFKLYPSEKYIFDPNQDYPNLKNCFDEFCEEYQTNDLWDYTLDYIEKNLPNQEIWMTEFNTKPSSNFNNSLGNAGFIFSRFMNYSHRVKVLCVHNMVAPDIYGIISRTNNFDIDKTTKNNRRSGYYAMKLASEALQYNKRQVLSNYQEVFENTCFYYDNTLGNTNNFEISPFKPTSGGIGNEITKVITGYLQSFNNYDSFGKIGYLNSKTKAFKPNLTFYTQETKTPPNQNSNPEFGYIYVEVADKNIKPVRPCNKKSWKIWKKPCVEQ